MVLAAGLVRRAALRHALRFGAGFALTLLALFAATLPGGGLGAWREFGEKIGEHDERPASDTIGFRSVFLWTVDFERNQGHEDETEFHDQGTVAEANGSGPVCGNRTNRRGMETVAPRWDVATRSASGSCSHAGYC